MYRIVDAEKRNASRPDTFQIPTQAERDKLSKDDSAKVIFEGDDGSAERMWLTVALVIPNPRRYLGIVDNTALSSLLPKLGESVTFEPRHVIDIELQNDRAN